MLSRNSVPRRRLTRPVRARGAGAAFMSVAAAAVLALAVAVPVAADDPLPRLDSPLTDTIDILTTGQEADVVASLEALRKDANVQLFVLYTDTTGSESAPEFAARTAAFNSLGANDAVLVVAFDDRSYALWVADGLAEVSDAEIDDILSTSLEPRLLDSDFGGAAIAAAAALGEAAAEGGTTPSGTAAPGGLPPGPGSSVAPVPSAGTGSGQVDGERGGFNLSLVIAILVAFGGLFLIVRTVVVRRSSAKADAEERDRLSREANTALLSVDELLRDAEQEVGFAEAQWGDAEAKPFREAMLRATAELKAAFAVRQQLDDHVPDTSEQRRAMLAEIVERTGRARTELESQADRLDGLRDLERTAPELLAALPPVIEALRPRRAAAATLLARIVSEYAPSATGSVQGNLVEADKCIETATTETERGIAAAVPRRSEAVTALRRAQEAVACATRLMDGVERLGARLDEAAAQALPELTEAEADVERARGAVLGGGAAGMQDALAQADRLLGEARRAVQASPMDPLAALDRAVAAHKAADGVLSGIQAAELALQRQAQVLDRSLLTARGRVDRAVDYITTRRHGVGQRARVRAAEAEARLKDAELFAATDPVAALEAATSAQQLADEAYSLAASEFDGWNDQGGPVAGPYRRSPMDSPEAQVIGAVLGGILGGVLSGGGGRGSGWGGSTWGGTGGGRSGGGGFGLPSGPRGGSWGGGGTRSGGGGGGRSRGGRW